jgi:hypothetical protein
MRSIVLGCRCDVALQIHGIDLLLVIQLGLETDELHGVRQDIFVCEAFRFEVDVFSHLQTVEPLTSAQSVEVLEHTSSELQVSEELLVGSVELVLLGKSQKMFFVGCGDENGVIF